MDTLLFKTFCGVAIFIMGIMGGVIPMCGLTKPRLSNLMEYGEFFARGIFLGAALIHLLPEAWMHFLVAYPNMTYPVIGMVCAMTVFFIQFIEQSAMRIFSVDYLNPRRCLSYLLFIFLSIHAIIEGAALGISDTITGALTLFIAVIAHKASEAFALMINMSRAGVKRMSMVMVISLFALMTPVGIFLGSGLLLHLSGENGHLAQALFNAVAAGTFIYIAMFEPADRIKHSLHEESTLGTMSCFGGGILIMALAAFWL